MFEFSTIYLVIYIFDRFNENLSCSSPWHDLFLKFFEVYIITKKISKSLLCASHVMIMIWAIFTLVDLINKCYLFILSTYDSMSNLLNCFSTDVIDWFTLTIHYEIWLTKLLSLFIRVDYWINDWSFLLCGWEWMVNFFFIMICWL